MKIGHIWLDGRVMDYCAASVAPLSHSISYATAVYEGIRSYGGHIFLLDQHLARLRTSADVFSHDIPFDNEFLTETCYSLLEMNGLSDAYIKIQVFFDDADISFTAKNCASRILIVAIPKPTVGPAGGWNLSIAAWRRPPANCHPYGAKTSSTYALSYLGYRSRKRSADDILFLCHDGFVCEASGANVFFVHGRRLVTPRTTTSLAGITRQLVLDRLAEMTGYEVEVRDIPVGELPAFDAAFLCGTAVEIRGVAQIDAVRYDSDAVSKTMLDAMIQVISEDRLSPGVKGFRRNAGQWLMKAGLAR